MILFLFNLVNGFLESFRRWRIYRLQTKLNRLQNQVDEWHGIVLKVGRDDFGRLFMVVAAQRRYVPEWLGSEVRTGDRLAFKGGVYMVKKYHMPTV